MDVSKVNSLIKDIFNIFRGYSIINRIFIRHKYRNLIRNSRKIKINSAIKVLPEYKMLKTFPAFLSTY